MANPDPSKNWQTSDPLITHHLWAYKDTSTGTEYMACVCDLPEGRASAVIQWATGKQLATELGRQSFDSKARAVRWVEWVVLGLHGEEFTEPGTEPEAFPDHVAAFDGVIIHDPLEHQILQERCHFCNRPFSWLSEDPATYYGVPTMVSRTSALTGNTYTDPACLRCAAEWAEYEGAVDKRTMPQDSRIVYPALRALNGGGSNG